MEINNEMGLSEKRAGLIVSAEIMRLSELVSIIKESHPGTHSVRIGNVIYKLGTPEFMNNIGRRVYVDYIENKTRFYD